MKTCLIISGGDFAGLPEDLSYEYCIACDKGYEHAMSMKIVPDVIIGDFDSVSSSFMGDAEQYGKVLVKADAGIQVITFPVEKDDTDTMLAIKHAISLGYSHIILGCSLGGRYDHTMANIQSMAYIASHGCICELYGEQEYMRTITGNDGICSIPQKSGYAFSLFSLSDICENLTINGAKYNVSGVTLTNDFPLGHGNSWAEDVATVSISSGILLLIESKLEM